MDFTAIFGHPEEREWMQRGRCRGRDPALFFPDNEQRDWIRRVVEAQAICSPCGVKSECLEWALSNNETNGVWGGASERERRRIKSKRASKALKQQEAKGLSKDVPKRNGDTQRS